MKKIFGQVLVKESLSKVPNLEVHAFDSEKPIDEIFTKSGKEQKISLNNLGKRIGSVLTDTEGKFIISTDESRPDLLLVILAPADIQDPAKPYPKSDAERLLFISNGSREDSGAEEAFNIRLLQAQIDKHKILTISSSKQSSSNNLADAIENSWEFRDNLKDRLEKRLQNEADKSEKRQEEARKKVTNLSAIPLHLRDGKTENRLRNNDFLINDKKELNEKLADLQEKAVTEGLKRLDKSKNKHSLRLLLTKEDLAELGLKVVKGELFGEVNSKKLQEKMKSKMNGVEIIRTRGLNNPSPDELEKKYLS